MAHTIADLSPPRVAAQPASRPAGPELRFAIAEPDRTVTVYVKRPGDTRGVRVQNVSRSLAEGQGFRVVSSARAEMDGWL